MALPVKKIYVDSQYKTASSQSTSSFSIELPHSIYMPPNSIFMIDEVCIPNAWYTVEEGMNDKLYFFFINTFTGSTYSRIIALPNGNYNGTRLATNIKTALDNAIIGSLVFSPLSVSFNAIEFNINISTTDVNNRWYILTDNDLKTRLGGQFTTSFDSQNPATMNDILRNYSDNSQYSSSRTYESDFLNLQSINNIYISSPNLGNFTTIGPRGEESIIRKVPVSSDFGYMIIDRSTTNHDYLECGKLALKTIEFNPRDSKGRLVPLHGSNVSFSIIFSLQKEDL
jgi:hypothetical protein